MQTHSQEYMMKNILRALSVSILLASFGMQAYAQYASETTKVKQGPLGGTTVKHTTKTSDFAGEVKHTRKTTYGPFGSVTHTEKTKVNP